MLLRRKHGFTLIELSIVLVIIGLIIGGILVGRDLLRASYERAQLTQIEKLQVATNTFRGKYGFLPGDIREPDATQFGFTPRGIYAGEGDGNGVIEGVGSNAANNNYGVRIICGETTMFWVDLSKANLSPGNFLGSPNIVPAVATTTTTPAISDYFPRSALRDTTYVYAYSGMAPGGTWAQNGVNHFGLSALTQTYPVVSNRGITVREAFDMDTKIDDGLPQSGAVFAAYLNVQVSSLNWVHSQGTTPATTALVNNSASCYGNNNVNGDVYQYTINVNGGSGVNCAISFDFK